MHNSILKNKPKLSVLMPVYNAEKYLANAINSILSQTFTDYELIAIDDGSTDNSYKVLQEFAKLDNRLKVSSRSNTGIVGVLNEGLTFAAGELIARMDADDICTSDRFTKQVDFLEKNPSHMAVSCQVILIDPEGELIQPTYKPLKDNEIRTELEAGNSSAFIHAATIMRRDAVIKVGGYRREYQKVEDLDLFLRLSEIGKLANLPEFLYLYRQHIASTCYTDRSFQQQLKIAIVQEMHKKRGTDFAKIHVHHTPSSVGEIHRSWATSAFNAGNMKTARKHVFKALELEPWSVSSWRLLFYVLSGQKRIGKFRILKHQLKRLINKQPLQIS